MDARPDSSYGTPFSMKRFISIRGGQRPGNRLRTRLIGTLLLSSVLTAGIIQFGAPNVGLFEWAVSGGVTTILVSFAFREMSRSIKDNVFSEPSGSTTNYIWLILLVVLYVSWSLVEEHLVHYRSLIQLLGITLATSFFLSASVTLGWLMIYERRNGPVYVVRA